MYDMYPEWGPARHRLPEPALVQVADGPALSGGLLSGVQTGLDLRDNGGQRPDDN